MIYRRYRLPGAWQEMDRLQREMNRLFETHTPARLRPAPGFPALNLWSNADGLVVTAEVPGIDPKDIEINVVGDTLTLSGEREVDEVEQGARYHRQERGFGRFTRSLQLPYSVNVKKVEATFKNGVLHIELPRAEEDKPRKIAVRTV
ncbi:MAG: Hsp20/alpha crystallin family protein [Anaerolineales bacterium]|nr:Hsp20/alpha crystallin family protein [Anaerolineales bacterium]